MDREQIEEFFERLTGPEGCDFKLRDEDDPESITWACGGGYNQDLSRKILTGMNIPWGDQEKLLDRCRELGGHCDCEILFNAAKVVVAEAGEV